MDDAKWNGSGYSPEKAWNKIKRDEAEREFDRKHPLTQWDRIRIPLTLAALVICGLVCAGGLLLWLFSAPFAP